MHDALFNNQVQGPYDRGAFGRDRLDRIAETVGDLDMDAWGSCMDDDTYEDQVEDETDSAGASGVEGTPSFVVNGQLMFGASYEELTQAIQEALGSS